jgi:hypothetical protein
LHEVSKEQASFWRADTAKRHAHNLFSFPKLPWPIGEDWNRLAEMHPYVLELAYVDAARETKDKWNRTMRLIRATPGVEPLTLVHEKIRLLHEMHAVDLPCRNSITSIIIPSTAYLNSIDDTRSMSLEEVREAIRGKRHQYEDMLSNPAGFEANNPDMCCEEMVDLYESFHLLEPLEEKWGRWVTSKCICEDFMSAAICSHSTMLALLYDVTLKFPPRQSTKKLQARGKVGRRPSAWAPEQEDVEDDEDKGQMLHWCPTTACHDMDLVPLPRTKVVMRL